MLFCTTAIGKDFIYVFVKDSTYATEKEKKLI